MYSWYWLHALSAKCIQRFMMVMAHVKYIWHTMTSLTSHMVSVTYTAVHIHIQHALYWPAPRLLRSFPPAVPTSTVKVYWVVGSRSSITTLELVVLTVLIARATRPTCEEDWYVTKYTGNPLASWRVSGVQLTRAALLFFTLSTFTLLTWAVGAVRLKEIRQ